MMKKEFMIKKNNKDTQMHNTWDQLEVASLVRGSW